MTRILWDEEDVASTATDATGPAPARRPSPRSTLIAGVVLLVAVGVALLTQNGVTEDSAAEAPSMDGSAGPLAPVANPPQVRVVVVTAGAPVDVIDLASGMRRQADSPLPAAGGAAPLGEEAVYVSNGRAIALAFDGTHRSLGDATAVRAARDGWIWLGQFQQRIDRVDVVDWYEVDALGEQRRAVPRHSPLEFIDPGLVWGFQGSVHRLTVSEDPRFSIVSYGLPVAAGVNAVIMKTCTRGECVRRWFSTVDGRDGGEVLSDLAEDLQVEQNGVISPDGRWIVARTPGGTAIDLHRMRDATRVELPCSGMDQVTWSTEGAAMACVGNTGVVVVDLETLALHALDVPTDDSTRAVLFG